MATRFRLSPEATTQLGDILEFLADENPAAALRVRNAIYEACEQLAGMPGMGHSREDLTERPVKFWSVFSYLLVYDPSSDPLEIVAVIHGARNVEQILKTSQ